MQQYPGNKSVIGLIIDLLNMILFRMKLCSHHISCLQSFPRLLKVFLFFLAIIILLNTTASGQNNFNPGEELEYVVYFGPINAGVANINLNRTVHNNEQVFYSKLEARSIGLPDKIYKVKDIYESYFDSITVTAGNGHSGYQGRKVQKEKY